MSATLSCGHAPTEPRPAHTTGYAVASDGRKMCFACADDAERAALRRATRFTAYLSGDLARVTTWPGGELATVTSHVVRRVGFGGATRVYFRAVDGGGSVWHGQSAGPGMVATMRLSKRQPKGAS